MNNPKISVLMPVYNAEKFLKEAIDSILNQTFKDFEFLIINDASTDKSKKIILSYKDKRIRYFENRRNLGVAASLNKGLSLAKADLIARMDADDISYPKRLELQYRKIQADREIAVLASFYDIADENGKYLYQERYAESPEEIYYTLQFRNCLGHATVMLRKHIIFDILGGYDKNHDAEDYDLWLKISSRYKIYKINASLLKLRVSKVSRISVSNRKIDDDAIFLAKKNLTFLTQRKINSDTLEILRRNFTLFRLNVSINFSQEQIRKALIILEDVNKEVIVRAPTFLSKIALSRIIAQKAGLLKSDLYLARILDSKFGYILKFFCRLYFFVKRKLMSKINQLFHFLTNLS